MYDKNNLGWRIYLLQKRFQEWWELQTTQAWEKVEGVPLFNWLDSEVVKFIAGVAFWVILALVVIWAVRQLSKGLSLYLRRLRRDSSQVNQTKFKNLDGNAWLKESLHFEQQGNYREACLSLYRAMLQLLHDRGIALHQESRTDGEYLNLVSNLPQWLYYHRLIITHQRLCFGRVDASLSLFQDCLQAYREIEKQ